MARRCGSGITVIVGVAMLAASVAMAADTESVRLDEMVVTATRTAQAVEKIPASVTVITREQIEASNAASVPDLLRQVSGINVGDLNGNGQNQTIDMGGFGETANRHVAVVIDGRRINPIDQSGPRWSAIDLASIERIEVMAGGGSVLYGDQAMGGVVNIITRTPEEGLKMRVEAGGGTLGTKKLAAGINYGTERTGLVVNAGTRSTDGYRDNSDADQNSFAGKLTRDFGDHLSARLQLDHVDAEYRFPGSLTAAQMAQDRRQTRTPNDKEDVTATTVSTGLEVDMDDAGRFDLGVTFRDENRDVDMVSWFTYSIYDLSTWTVNAKYVLDRPVAGGDNRLTAGIDFSGDNYDLDTGWTPAANTNHFRHSRDTWAGYLQDEIELFDALVLNLGLRTERPDTELRAEVGGVDTAVDKDESEYAWNLGLAYRFMDRSKVYARAYRAYRYPVVDEYTSTWTGAMNENLHHETAIGYEAGIEGRPWAPVTAGLRLFTFDVDDEIGWNGVTFQNENIGETRHQGAELKIRYSPFDILSLFANGALTDVEFRAGDNSGKKVPLVPEFEAHGGIALQWPSGLAWQITYNYVGERHSGGDYANTLAKMDAYETVDAHLSYTWRQVELFVDAANIFDEAYSDSGWAGTYYPMPEATYFAGMRLQF